VSDLEVRLVELGGALDHPDGEQLLARFRAEIDGGTASDWDTFFAEVGPSYRPA